VIEGIAKLPWCSGNVGLAGNSHLGIVQWFIAALRPPSLKAIAPWEAAGDLYREQFARGGVWDSALFDTITAHVIKGNGGLEHLAEMYRRSPLQNNYWKDKRADIKNVNIPTYIVASYSTFVHTMGSIRGWLGVDTTDKWLRWDPYQEWFDLWTVKESRDELERTVNPSQHLQGELDYSGACRLLRDGPQRLNKEVQVLFRRSISQFSQFLMLKQTKVPLV
jgi:predicted acyl esterase